MCLCLHTYKELPAQDGTDLHVRLLPGAGFPTHHHSLLTQRLQGAFCLDTFSIKAFQKRAPAFCATLPCCALSLSLPRLVSSGRSERRCTPALPAATTWAKTTPWPKTWRFSCCSTSSFPATARADEVQITFISRIRTQAHKHPFCALTYTVKYLELHFKPHCAHILHLPAGKCILHIQPFMYTIIHTQTTSVGTDLICWAWTVSINITSPKFNRRHFLFFFKPPSSSYHTKDKRTKGATIHAHSPPQEISSCFVSASTVLSIGSVNRNAAHSFKSNIMKLYH